MALTEFGGYSFHVDGHSFNGQEYGYRKYHSGNALTEAIESLWRRDLFRNIARGLSASVYTQVSDVEDETNGFLTYDRDEVKVDAERILKVNRQLLEIFENQLEKQQVRLHRRDSYDQSINPSVLE